MNKKQAYIVTSVIYRKFQRMPDEKFDNGIAIFTHVEADSEEEVKMIAEYRVKRDFFVDEYRFVKIEKSESWMAERLAESADSMLNEILMKEDDVE